MFVDMNHTDTATNGLTVPAAAARAGVNQLTIRQAIHEGDLPATTVLYVAPSDLDAWTDKYDAEAQA